MSMLRKLIAAPSAPKIVKVRQYVEWKILNKAQVEERLEQQSAFADKETTKLWAGEKETHLYTPDEDLIVFVRKREIGF